MRFVTCGVLALVSLAWIACADVPDDLRDSLVTVTLRFADGGEKIRPGVVVHQGHVVFRLGETDDAVCGAEVLTRSGETIASPGFVALLRSRNLALALVDWPTPPPSMPISETTPRERSVVRILNPLAPRPERARVTHSEDSGGFHLERKLTDTRRDGIVCVDGRLAGIVVGWSFSGEFKRLSKLRFNGGYVVCHPSQIRAIRPGDLVAWSELRAAIKQEEEAHALGSRARQLCTDEPARAMEIAQEALRLHPAATDALRTLMVIHAQQEKYHESLRMADRVLELEPFDVVALCAKANLELHLGYPATAAVAARSLVELEAKPEHLLVLARALRRLGDVEGSMNALRMAALLAGPDSEYQQLLDELVKPEEPKPFRLNENALVPPPEK